MTGNEFFRTITEEILDYVVREMFAPEGGFFSTQDADSEGKEGRFFVWTPDEIRAVLDDEADAFMKAHSVTPGGNFEDRNILEFVGELDQRPTLAEARRCDAQPATHAVILDRVEIAIEIIASALAAADLADRYIPDPSVAASPHIAGVFDF